MIDDLPATFWLIIAIVAMAWAPATYVFRYVAHSRSGRDITRPPVKLEWREKRLLLLHSAILVVLLSLAVFIFTPTASRLARSELFLPILLLAIGAWALWTVPRGIASGQIEPIVRGFSASYERDAHPRRFWASVAWNAALGILFLWMSFVSLGEVEFSRCYNVDESLSYQEALAACNESIGQRDKDDPTMSDLIAARGVAHYQSGNYHRALEDYSEAIRLGPQDSARYYNRGLVHEKLGDDQRAIDDYGASIERQAGNKDAYNSRGLIFLDQANYEQALADFNRAHEIDPDDHWPLANRGITYAWMNERARAEADFAAVRAKDPSNDVAARGEALLSMQSGQFALAVQQLTSALEQDPYSLWSLGMRAEAYGRLGEYEKAQADLRKRYRLMNWGRTDQPRATSTPPTSQDRRAS